MALSDMTADEVAALPDDQFLNLVTNTVLAELLGGAHVVPTGSGRPGPDHQILTFTLAGRPVNISIVAPCSTRHHPFMQNDDDERDPYCHWYTGPEGDGPECGLPRDNARHRT